MANKEQGSISSWKEIQRRVSVTHPRDIRIDGVYPGDDIAYKVVRHHILVHKGKETNLYKHKKK